MCAHSPQNLALNVAEKGFTISVFNRSSNKTDEAVKRAAKEGASQETVVTFSLATSRLTGVRLWKRRLVSGLGRSKCSALSQRRTRPRGLG